MDAVDKLRRHRFHDHSITGKSIMTSLIIMKIRFVCFPDEFGKSHIGSYARSHNLKSCDNSVIYIEMVENVQNYYYKSFQNLNDYQKNFSKK